MEKSLNLIGVSLGKKTGPKEYEGDQRTPEGLYWINWRKKSDNFNLAMHISYPNAKDLQRSEEIGLAARWHDYAARHTQ